MATFPLYLGHHYHHPVQDGIPALFTRDSAGLGGPLLDGLAYLHAWRQYSPPPNRPAWGRAAQVDGAGRCRPYLRFMLLACSLLRFLLVVPVAGVLAGVPITSLPQKQVSATALLLLVMAQLGPRV
jgi:hypothetical protein